jgi:tripartite-type tricarboxylate transporter receptor subunit TctC
MNLPAIMVSTLIGLLSTFAPARADDAYPSRPVTLIVPNSAGGGMDIVGRMLVQKLASALGQAVVVDNRPGGAENIGNNAAAKAPPDGYTLLLASNSITINPSLFKSLPYDASRDLQPIGRVTALALLIAASPSAPYKTLPELIAYAKAHPKELSYGSPGVGTPHHLGMELFKSTAGIDIQHIPYKGTAPSLTDILGGNIPLIMTTVAPSEAHLRSGKLRPLATLSRTRLSQFPDVPAVNETLPGFDVDIWHGVFVPAATPLPIVAKLTSILEGVVRDPELVAQFGRVGVLTSWAPPAELRETVTRERAKWATAIKNAGIQPD